MVAIVFCRENTAPLNMLYTQNNYYNNLFLGNRIGRPRWWVVGCGWEREGLYTLLSYPAHSRHTQRLGAWRQADRLLRKVLRQLGLQSSAACASCPSSIGVEPVVIGDTFPSAGAFRNAFERNMTVFRRQSKADQRVFGGKEC